MPTLETQVYPGSTATVTPAGPGPGGPSELENFYRELLRRQAISAQPQAQGYSLQPQPRAYSSVGANPPREQAPSFSDRTDPLANAQRNDAMQELAYRQRLRQIDLNPPVKYIDSRPGIQGGYIQDTTLLPVSMRPQNAQIQHGPQDAARAQGQFQNDQAYQAKIDADRARTQNTNLSYYGRG